MVGISISNFTASAAPQTFVVDSTLDTSDANPGDGTCETAGAVCTLRAAIEEANANAGADTINFELSGTADFINNSNDGFRISPVQALPTITEALTINGFSQPGASQNSAAYPNPFNTTILVQIADTELADGVDTIIGIDASDVTIRGLNIPRKTVNDQTKIISVEDSSNVVIAGNYIGVNANGLEQAEVNPLWEQNFVAAVDIVDSVGVTVGGDSPEDRNIITGVVAGIVAASSDLEGAYSTSQLVIQGNYFGTGADGVTDTGARHTIITLSHVSDVLIGDEDGAHGNTIENGVSYGLRIDNGSTDIVIAGNRIVENRRGIYVVDSDNIDIGLPNVTDSSNLISFNIEDGIIIEDSNSVVVAQNDIGVDQSGENALPNAHSGVSMINSQMVSIQNNVISGNDLRGIELEESDNNIITGNFIGTDRSGEQAIPNGEYVLSPPHIIPGTKAGILLSYGSGNNIVGGTGAEDGNIIANNIGAGIATEGFDATSNSIIGNSIHSNSGLGIDLENDGVTLNDDYDTDSGSNDLLNYPTGAYVKAEGDNTKVVYSLSNPEAEYRVDFYTNLDPDESGYGEGLTHLGSQIVEKDDSSSQKFEHTISASDITNLTMTTTLVDDEASTGFGSTSEFSQVTPAFQIADISISGSVTASPDLKVGDTLSYAVNLHNNGPGPLPLNIFAESETAPFIFLLPPYISIQSMDAPEGLFCSTFGPGSAVIAGALAEDHSDYELAICFPDESNAVLESGDTLTVNLVVEVVGTPPEQFNLYVASTPLEYDPSDRAIYDDFIASNQDMITAGLFTQSNNYTFISYPPPIVDQADNNAGRGSSDDLANSGIDLKRLIIYALLMLALALVIKKLRRLNLQLYKGTTKISLVVVVGSLGLLSGLAYWHNVSAASAGDVIINEIMYNPDSDNQQDEFLELYNRTTSDINLENWCITSGVTLCFDSSHIIPAESYIIVSPNIARSELTYSVTPIAEYTGNLSNSGETITLRDQASNVINSFTYDDTEPWSTAPDALGPSLELRHPSRNNSLATSWGASIGNPTPGLVNSLVALSSPIVSSVSRPQNVQSSQQPTITAQVEDAETVELVYKVMFGAEQTVEMFDDGAHGDGAANNGVFGGRIPAQAAGQLVRYKVVAENGTGAMSKPGTDDSINYYGFVVQNPAVASQIPILQWFMDPDEYEDMVANHVYDKQPFPTVIAYGNQVFDNSQINVKGVSSLDYYKKSFAVDLPKGYTLQIPGAMERPVDELHLNGDIPDNSAIIVPLVWEIAADAGMDVPQSFKTRVQLNGEFHGLFTFMEEYDAAWREEFGYENKLFYNDQDKRTRLQETDDDPVVDHTTIGNFNGRSEARRDYTLDSTDVPSFINFMAFRKLIGDWDWGVAKNTITYKDIENSDRWSVLPWDMDSALQSPGHENLSPYDIDANYLGRHQWVSLYDEPDLREMYFRRVRTLADKWYGGDNLFLQRYLEEYERTTVERQLESEAWPGSYSPNDPNRIIVNISNRIKQHAIKFLYRYQLPWAVPQQQTSNPIVAIAEVSTGLDDAEQYVRLTNNSEESIDMSGWKIPELDFTFSGGSVILPNQSVYLARHDRAFTQANSGEIVFGSFSVNLDAVADTKITLNRVNDSKSSELNY